MIRRSPAELYIQYLILHPKAHDNAQICEILDYVQLDALGNWYLDKLRRELHPPTPFFPLDRSHRPSKGFLLDLGLYDVFHPSKDVATSFRILERPRVKEFVESMLVVGAPSVAIAHGVTRQRNFVCSVKDVERYKSLFWNVDLLDSTEIRALLQFRVDRLSWHANPEVKSQAKSVKRASYRDPRVVASELPFSPLSALLAQMQMGVAPARLDLSRVLEYSMNMVGMRVYEATLNNRNGDSTKALDYASVLLKLAESKELIVKPDEKLREQLAEVALRTVEGELPTLHSLSSGRHTADLMPKENRNEVPAEGDDDGDGSDDPVEFPGG